MKKDEEIDRLHVLREVEEGNTSSHSSSIHNLHSLRVDSKTETDGSTGSSCENYEVVKTAANNTNIIK